MASFFKRVLTAALERREEVRDIELARQEKAVEVGVDRLKKAEQNRIKKLEVIKKGTRAALPIVDAVKAQKGIDVSPELALATLSASNNDSELAMKVLLSKGSQLKQVQTDASKAEKQTQELLSQPTTMPASVQAGQEAGQMAIQATRAGESKVGDMFVNALFGALTGQPNRSTRDIIKERYVSLFPDAMEGEKNYEQATAYLSKVISGEETDDDMPTLQGEEAGIILPAISREKDREPFMNKLPTAVLRALKEDYKKADVIRQNFDIPPGLSLSQAKEYILRSNKKGITKEQALEEIDKVGNRRIAIEERARDLFNSGLLPLGSTAFEAVKEAERQLDNGLDIRGVVIPANEENPNAQFTKDNMKLALTNKKVLRETNIKKKTQDLLSIEDPAKLLQWARKNIKKENVERDFEGLKIRKIQGKFIATREDGKQFLLKQEGVGDGLRGLVVDKELGAE
tara:strand:+ start:1369 stop:2742 length:1374 start_codon:yes stop_codon:yes gene_type:complete